MLLMCIATALAGPVADVEALLDGFHAAAASADGATYFGSLTDDAVFIGTDATERWTRAEFEAFAAPYFERDSAWTYRPLARHVTMAPGGRLAWFDERLHNDKYGETRGSGVVVREGKRWRIAQYVLSFAVPNEVSGEVVGIIAGADP